MQFDSSLPALQRRPGKYDKYMYICDKDTSMITVWHD